MKKQAFDNYAFDYDKHFTYSSIGKAQRNQVYRFTEEYVNGTNALLEINCGTGEDAVLFSTKVKRILGTDISSAMINVADKKKGSIANIEFKCCNATEIDSVTSEKYDLVFSNFGGLNCLSEEELIQFRSALSSLVKTKTKLLFVIMGTKCTWERFYYFIKGKTINRRLVKEGVNTTISGSSFTTYYYSPDAFFELFKDEYQLVDKKPIGLFIPPSYLQHFFRNKKLLLKPFVLLEQLLSRYSWQANYADHYLIVLEKK